ncbi:hypothetical protein CC79DRAFT_1325081 [Sarocladium strictum]
MATSQVRWLIVTLLLSFLSFAMAIPTLPTATSTQAYSTSLPPTNIGAPRSTQPADTLLARDPQELESIPPYTAIVTAAPDQDVVLASQGWYQTTYFECRTWGGQEHCGWHVPLRQISGGQRTLRLEWRMGQGAVVCVVLAVLML